MLLWLYRFFIIGFPPKCHHDFDNWSVFKAMSNDQGVYVIYQGHTCKKCGFNEIKKNWA
jgi:predicted Zn-ribbon and HTH transcriptional regulator